MTTIKDFLMGTTSVYALQAAIASNGGCRETHEQRAARLKGGA